MAASLPAQENLDKLVYELLCILHQDSPAASTESILALSIQVLSLYQRRIQALQCETSSTWEKEWSRLAWPLLSLLGKLVGRAYNEEEHEIQRSLNAQLVHLVNKARQALPPVGISESNYAWQKFWRVYSPTLTKLHSLYSQISAPTPSLETSLSDFARNELTSYLETFRELCQLHRKRVQHELRLAQVARMANMGEMATEPVHTAAAYYNNVLYTLGIVAARLQGFRFESLQKKGLFRTRDPVGPLMDMVVQTMEQLCCDCLLATRPSTTAILVTNNLFPFDCGCLASGVVFRQFDVQIVSEETAVAIQAEIEASIAGTHPPSTSLVFPSAALLAMKPTSGVKRNNATANAEGGNTAHKKSDVNSRESVCILPSWNDKYNGWQSQYPHLLCTTRQKDTVLLDTRSGQMGKRPLFYFYINATMFSASGGASFVRTLSLPFTIATRRNQDCQVQRMMSSYTATCFWLYGLHNLDGLILNWCESGIPWSRFVQLYRAYFSVNAEASRQLSDDDFRLLEEKLDCDECREHTHDQAGGRLVTFKNVLCPHLRYDTEQNVMRFSIWRGLLEVLQIYQDTRTNVKQLWNDFILMGFNDIAVINELLLPHTSVMCLRLSYVIGGSICVSMRPSHGEIVHLEPIDLKRLQAKSAFEYLVDIAESAKIEWLLTAQHTLVSVSEVINKYRIGHESSKVPSRYITTNITHSGPVETTTKLRFTPLRIAVVCCDHAPSSLDPPLLQNQPINGFGGAQLNGSNGNLVAPRASFAAELDALMKTHGKTANDVLRELGFGVDSNVSFDPYIQQPEEYRDWTANERLQRDGSW